MDLSTPTSWVGCDKRSVFSKVLTGFETKVSLSKTCHHTKVNEPSLPSYLSLAGARIVKRITFPSVLVLRVHTYISLLFYRACGGARGVMVIGVGNGHGDTSSNPERNWLHFTLIPLGKVWIQLFSLQLWVNSRTDRVLQPWWGN